MRPLSMQHSLNMNHNTFFVSDLPTVQRQGVFIGTLGTGNGPGLHRHKLSYDLTVCATCHRKLQNSVEMGNYNEGWHACYVERNEFPILLDARIYILWGKMLHTNTTGNVTGHRMHAQFSFL
jgi:hypothetical protein